MVAFYNTRPVPAAGMMAPLMAGLPPERHVSAPLAPPAIGELSGALGAFCVAEAIPADTAWRLKVALDEILANIVSHGASDGNLPAIDIWFARLDDVIQVRIADDGIPFDPLSRPDPDVTAPLDARQPGGLGLALIKGLIDDVTYERTTRNVLTLRARIAARANHSEGSQP